MTNFYFVNDDGTYSEPIKAEAVDIQFTESECPSTADSIVGFECSCTFETDVDYMFVWYLYSVANRDCLTCRNCYEKYRYPGFVTAETCVCLAGLECDTVLYEVSDCPKYEMMDYNEERPHDPLLDKYMYVLRGDEE